MRSLPPIFLISNLDWSNFSFFSKIEWRGGAVKCFLRYFRVKRFSGVVAKKPFHSVVSLDHVIYIPPLVLRWCRKARAWIINFISEFISFLSLLFPPQYILSYFSFPLTVNLFQKQRNGLSSFSVSSDGNDLLFRKFFFGHFMLFRFLCVLRK